MPDAMGETIENSLKRLVSLAGTDEGFYVLALHAFIEGYCNSLKPGFTATSSFPMVIEYLQHYLEVRARMDFRSRQCMNRIVKDHDLSNKVRHQFLRLSSDEAVAATYNFLGFCKAFGIDSQALGLLRATEDSWKQCRAPLELLKELEYLKGRLREAEQSEASLSQKLQQFDLMERRLKELGEHARLYESEISQLKETAERRGEKADNLRRKLNEVTTERDKILTDLEGLQEIRNYLDYLERFSAFTRTRLDYERSVLALSPEQKSLVELACGRGDYIIKGGAGTGKTLVLLHALERQLASRGEELIATEGKIILLTYTTTLVKYSRYLSDIVGRHGVSPQISTADSFLLGLLRKAVTGGWIDFKAPGNVIGDYNATSFLSNQELATEVEDVIWGNRITKQEYLEQHILRRGMKQPLNRTQREVVWEIQENLRKVFIASKQYPQNLAAAELIEILDSNPELRESCMVDRIFIDEAQDLSSAIIGVFKRISRRGIVLAADEGQSIYRIGTSYARADLEISGHVRHLHENYRNTRQIHEFAESINKDSRVPVSSDAAEGEPRYATIAREGPEPEIVMAADEQGLLDALLHYVDLMRDRLGYDPENIGIVAPTNDALNTIKNRLAAREIQAASVRDNGFDFVQPGIVRLSTLHSSKGIEFPVVLVFVPSLPEVGDYDERSILNMQRNLLYVSITRAMDHVILFTLKEPANPILRGLVDSFGSGTVHKT